MARRKESDQEQGGRARGIHNNLTGWPKEGQAASSRPRFTFAVECLRFPLPDAETSAIFRRVARAAQCSVGGDAFANHGSPPSPVGAQTSASLAAAGTLTWPSCWIRSTRQIEMSFVRLVQGLGRGGLGARQKRETKPGRCQRWRRSLAPRVHENGFTLASASRSPYGRNATTRLSARG